MNETEREFQTYWGSNVSASVNDMHIVKFLSHPAKFFSQINFNFPPPHMCTAENMFN